MENEKFNLTKEQENIWLTDKFYQTNSISNIGGTLMFKENVDLNKLERTVNLVIENNSALQICIKEENGKPFQYTKKPTYTRFKRFFLNSEEELKKKEKEFINTNLNYPNEYLYQFRLVKLKNGTGGVNITCHHLIFDAWGMSILINEIVDIYLKLKKSKKIEIEPFPSYIDYIQTEEKYLNSEKFKKDQIYWEDVFKEAPSSVTFSANNSPSDNPKANRSVFSLEESDLINEYCRNKNVSVFAFFCCIYAIYLYRTTNIKDIVLGTPVLNRNGAKEKNTIGMFVNTLPMNIHIEDEFEFWDLVKIVYKNQFTLFRHHKYPYSYILKYVREKYNFSNNLYDTIISYQNARDDSRNSEIKYSTNWDFCGEISNTLDIHMYDMDDTGVLQLIYDYQTQKLNEEEIQNIHKRIIYVINQVLKNENVKIEELELLDEKEKDIIKSFNDNKTEYKNEETLISLFEKQAKETPKKVALIFKDEILTYEELYEKVCIYATYLKNKGIKKNTPVVLLLNRSMETVISILATLKAGGYYIAIDPFWGRDRIDFIMKNSNSNFLITSKTYVANYETKINCILVETLNNIKNYEDIKSDTTPDDLAYILYTSGSTGEPKGTLITNKNVVGLLNSTHHIFKQTQDDVWTLFHTYTFDFSTWEIYGSLLYGGKLVIVPKEITTDPKNFLKLVIQEKVTILNQTPAYFYKVIEQEKVLNLSADELKIRYVILGGEAVQAKPLKYFKDKYPSIIIYNGYGPTETTVFAIMGEITKQNIEENDIYIGKPISNYEIHILDNNLNLLPVGVNGEICISGVGVCNGYFKKEDLTKQKFIQTKEYGLLYKSGDVGHFCQNGQIRYIGRNDNQVKIRGFRIELEDIQKQILNCEYVKKAIVVPVENENFTKSLVAFFEAEKENIVNDVLEEIKKHLTSYMIPRIYQVDEFPINNNGKVDIKYLIKTFYKQNNNKDIVQPRNETEKELVDILKTLTNVPNISITDNFFDDLGMDSLNVMDLATRLSKYNIEIQDISNYNTIEKLALKINKNQPDEFYGNKIQEDVKVVKTNFKYDLTNVLLTGTTGFLGSHIFYELLVTKDVNKIYCLIREKYGVSIQERFNKIIEDYFSDYNIKDIIEQKVVLVKGDFEKENFNMTDEEYTQLKTKITTVINSGARVSHYGKYETFYNTNVKSTKNVIKFCEEAKCSLAHISTMSVGGFCKITDKIQLTEDEINIDQNFRNQVYMITKYEAECEVLKAINNDNLNAKIFRLGNIMPRIRDGKFQVNVHQNGFLSRIKTIFDAKAITENINNMEIDISPVDICAHFIVKLMQNNCEDTIYHIGNAQLVKIKDLISKFGIQIKEVDQETCIELIKSLNQPLNAHLINDLITPDYMETPFNTEKTVKTLEKIGLSWPELSYTYLNNLYKLISEI